MTIKCVISLPDVALMHLFETCDFYMPVIHMPSKIDVYIVIFIQTSNKC